MIYIFLYLLSVSVGSQLKIFGNQSSALSMVLKPLSDTALLGGWTQWDTQYVIHTKLEAVLFRAQVSDRCGVDWWALE